MYFLRGQQNVFPLAGPCDTKQQDFVIVMSGQYSRGDFIQRSVTKLLDGAGDFPSLPFSRRIGKRTAEGLFLARLKQVS